MSYLTRLRRPSSLSNSNASAKQLHATADNFVYDVDSATSPSSSDSDCSPRTISQATNKKGEKIIAQDCKYSLVGDQKSRHAKSLNIVDKLTNRCQTFPLANPLNEKSRNEKSDTESFSRLRRLTRSKDAILQK